MPQTHPGRTVVWNTPATVVSGVTNVAVMVRYPDGEVIPVGVPTGQTALQFSLAFADPAFADFTVTAARLTEGSFSYESVAL